MTTLMPYNSPKKRVNITLPISLLKAIDQKFPNQNRSQVLVEAAIQKLADLEKRQRQQSLKKGYQYSNQLYANEQKDWESIAIKDAPEEEYEA